MYKETKVAAINEKLTCQSTMVVNQSQYAPVAQKILHEKKEERIPVANGTQSVNKQ